MRTLQKQFGRKAAATAGSAGEFWRFSAQYRGKIAWTYLLFVFENVLRLAQPLLIGWAINDLLKASWVGLAAFIVGHMLHMTMRLARQMYDTRAFTSIYTDRVTKLVLAQRASEVDVSKVAARSALTREFVEFFERHVPTVIQSVFSLVGAVVILYFYDWALVLFCLGLVGPALVLNFVFGRRSLRLSQFLHDQLEQEVDALHQPDRAQLTAHYSAVARWRIKLSDCEAYTAGLMELFVMVLLIAALVRSCLLPNILPGDIFAVFRYVLLFVMGLDRVPMVVQQISRLLDIGGRIGDPSPRKRASQLQPASGAL